MNKINKDKEIIQKLLKPSTVEVVKVNAPLPAGSLKPDPDRSLVHADFDSSNRLVLTFDDGRKIITKAIESNVNVQQWIAGAPSSGSTAPQDINVNIVNSDYSITDADDIVIVTAQALITLPLSSEKTFRVKRSGPGDVTIKSNTATVETQSEFVLDINLYSVDLHFDGNNNWVIL